MNINVINNCIYRKYHAFCHPGSEKRQFRIFSTSSGTQRRRNTTCATQSAAFSSICCVLSSHRDRPLTTGKGRCGYSLTVVHFRKVVISRKVGSAGNRPPVIYYRSYMASYNQPKNDDGKGKSSG
ncbi:hypothetical protein FZH95_17720 [Cronobacter sakazakii]|nr:hypothetical protein FZH95_17720 [Cronobacter sakazakii]